MHENTLCCRGNVEGLGTTVIPRPSTLPVNHFFDTLNLNFVTFSKFQRFQRLRSACFALGTLKALYLVVCSIICASMPLHGIDGRLRASYAATRLAA